MASCSGTSSPRRFSSSSRSSQSICALASAIGEADQFFAALRRRADQHEDALLSFSRCASRWMPSAQMWRSRFAEDCAFSTRCARPARPSFSRPMADADNPAASLPSSANNASEKSPVETSFEIEDRQQDLIDSTAHVRRQDRCRNRLRSGSAAAARGRAHAADGRRLDRYRRRLALWQVTVADDAPWPSSVFDRHACRESPRPRPRPPWRARHAPTNVRIRTREAEPSARARNGGVADIPISMRSSQLRAIVQPMRQPFAEI